MNNNLRFPALFVYVFMSLIFVEATSAATFAVRVTPQSKFSAWGKPIEKFDDYVYQRFEGFIRKELPKSRVFRIEGNPDSKRLILDGADALVTLDLDFMVALSDAGVGRPNGSYIAAVPKYNADAIFTGKISVQQLTDGKLIFEQEAAAKNSDSVWQGAEQRVQSLMLATLDEFIEELDDFPPEAISISSAERTRIGAVERIEHLDARERILEICSEPSLLPNDRARLLQLTDNELSANVQTLGKEDLVSLADLLEAEKAKLPNCLLLPRVSEALQSRLKAIETAEAAQKAEQAHHERELRERVAAFWAAVTSVSPAKADERLLEPKWGKEVANVVEGEVLEEQLTISQRLFALERLKASGWSSKAGELYESVVNTWLDEHQSQLDSFAEAKTPKEADSLLAILNPPVPPNSWGKMVATVMRGSVRLGEITTENAPRFELLLDWLQSKGCTISECVDFLSEVRAKRDSYAKVASEIKRLRKISPTMKKLRQFPAAVEKSFQEICVQNECKVLEGFDKSLANSFWSGKAEVGNTKVIGRFAIALTPPIYLAKVWKGTQMGDYSRFFVLDNAGEVIGDASGNELVITSRSTAFEISTDETAISEISLKQLARSAQPMKQSTPSSPLQAAEKWLVAAKNEDDSTMKGLSRNSLSMLEAITMFSGNLIEYTTPRGVGQVHLESQSSLKDFNGMKYAFDAVLEGTEYSAKGRNRYKCFFIIGIEGDIRNKVIEWDCRR